MWGSDKSHPHADEAPRDHDAREPAPRTPTLYDHGAGNFQNDVTEGEDARSQPDDAVVEAEIMWHLQGRRGEILAIQISDYIKQKDKGQKTNCNPTSGAASDVINANGSGNHISAQNWVGATAMETRPARNLQRNLPFLRGSR